MTWVGVIQLDPSLQSTIQGTDYFEYSLTVVTMRFHLAEHYDFSHLPLFLLLNGQ